MIKVIKVISDNFDNALFTEQAYHELTLQMSTGDWHTHTTEVVEVEDFTNVWSYGLIYEDDHVENYDFYQL